MTKAIEIVRKLAEIPCQKCDKGTISNDGGDDVACEHCSGKNARFPMLRYQHNHPRTKGKSCECHGANWLPKEPTLELAIAMLQSLHFHGVNLWWDGEILVEGLWRGNMHSYPADGHNPLEALWNLVKKVALK